MRTIFKFILFWLGILASVASLLGFYWQSSDEGHSRLKSFWHGILAAVKSDDFIIIAIAFSFILLLAYFVHVNQRNRGNISLGKLLWRFNPFAYTDTVYGLHNLQHFYCQVVDHIQKHRRPNYDFLGDPNLENHVFEFLKQTKKLVDRAIHGDVAVHIKIFEPKNTISPGAFTPKNVLLRTWLRVPSKRELNLCKEGTLDERENIEKFQIITGNSGQPSKLFEKQTEYEAKQVKVNSAYNYVFGNNEHYFICNDLPKFNRRKKFFSTSENWGKYYRSLAVFLLFPHIPNAKKIQHEEPFGLLIVDTYERGAFDHALAKGIGGYIAHRLFDTFDHFVAPCDKCNFAEEKQKESQHGSKKPEE